MLIQKTGPDSVLVYARAQELSGDIETHAKKALLQAGIKVEGKPQCDTYRLHGAALLFARAGKSRCVFAFRSADDLIDAARALHGDRELKNADLYASGGRYYLILRGQAPPALSEFARVCADAPEEGVRKLADDAFYELGKR